MTIEDLANGPPLDLAIIGGGINGCAIAEEAAARGLRVALFERDDFGFGTSWRSTKLIHGGLRYLEHGDLRLVFESLRERAWLLQTRDYLVKPQRFVLPILPWTRRPKWQLALGLELYDLLGLYRGVPAHQRLSDAALHALVPSLPGTTKGGLAFYDARAIAPERLCLDLALDAKRAGAIIANHTPVTGIQVLGSQVSAIEVEHNGRRFTIPVAAVVNAAGPWVDAVNQAAGIRAPELLGVTRGAHIVVELDEPPGRDAIFSTAREDGRVFFAVPQGDLLLVGTTDDRYEGDPGKVRPTHEDIDYLLGEAEALLPGMHIRQEDIRYAYAGLRPLQRVSGGPEAAITRRHAVIDHAENNGPRGLFSIVGGKLSTFRPLAEEVLEKLNAPKRDLPRAEAAGGDWRRHLQRSGLPREVKQHLRVYGGGIPAILAGSREVLCPHAHAIVGEVGYVCRNEQVETLADIMMRRTGISWAACRGLCCHERVAAEAARYLGWDDAERSRQLLVFEADLDFNLPREQDIA
jgi:glycerol-3-phosphate dehydrogenase